MGAAIKENREMARRKLVRKSGKCQGIKQIFRGKKTIHKKHEIIEWFFLNLFILAFGNFCWNCLDAANKYSRKFVQVNIMNGSERVKEFYARSKVATVVNFRALLGLKLLTIMWIINLARISWVSSAIYQRKIFAT